MTKTIAYCALICLATILIVVAVTAPTLISDHNAFLAGFVNHEMLNVLGVIVAITLASSAQLHLTLNSIEERLNLPNSFGKTRAGVLPSVYWLIALFLVALTIAILKPVLAVTAWSQALANGAAVLIVVWNVLILISLTSAVFAISSFPEGGEDDQA